jgi:hypothetical protein
MPQPTAPPLAPEAVKYTTFLLFFHVWPANQLKITGVTFGKKKMLDAHGLRERLQREVEENR